jgi:predicted nucleotidyltransferase
MALHAGCDLILELPVAYSAQPAQWFAYGSISVLEATGVVDSLCFGSESGDLQAMRMASSLLADEPAEFSILLSSQLKSGMPYPSAFSAAAKQYLASKGLEELAFSLEQPNHTLGLHYLMALRKINSRIEPFSLRREKSGYGQSDITDSRIASATALRKLMQGEAGNLSQLAPYVPPATLAILQREINAGQAPIHWEHFSQPLFHELLRQDVSGLADFAEVTEGLEYRIKKTLAGLPAFSVASLLQALKTKRYTVTKLQRTLLRILLGHHKELLTPAKLTDGVEYIRVLGFNERGRSLLRAMRKQASVPIVTSASGGNWDYLKLDTRASAVYALAYRNGDPSAIIRDFTQPPVRI